MVRNKENLLYHVIAPLLLVFSIVFVLWGQAIFSLFAIGVSLDSEFGEIQSTVNSFSFECPDGSDFRISILLPKKAINKNFMETFSGTIKICKDDTELWSHHFKLADLREAYWLNKNDKKDIEAFQEFIITANKKPFKYIELESILKKGNLYKIRLDFNFKPPQKTSLWLHYQDVWWKVKKDGAHNTSCKITNKG
jgi:hypothetical protein